MTPSLPGLVRRFALLTALRWFPIGLYTPVAVLLMQARGLDLATVGGLYAIYGIVTVALELPTGGLADVVGRRLVLVVAAATTTLSLTIAAFAQVPETFAVAMVVGAVGRALGSGPLDAWFVDAVHAIDPEISVRGGLSRAASGEALALGLGAIIGGLLPSVATWAWPAMPSAGNATLVTLSVPALAAAALMACYGLAVILIVHEVRPPWAGTRALVVGVPGTIREGVRLGLGDGILRRLMIRSALLGMVLAGVELLSPGTFAGLLGGEEKATGAYGFLAAAAFTASALGAGLAPAAAARLGGGARAAALMSWLAAPAAIAVAIPFIGGAAVGYIGIYLLLGVGGPLTSELLHSRVGASQRTTMLSVESLALQAGGVVSNLLLGTLVVATSAGAGFLVIAVCLLAAGALLFGIPDRPKVETPQMDGRATTEPA
jgi:hypothetical protein